MDRNHRQNLSRQIYRWRIIPLRRAKSSRPKFKTKAVKAPPHGKGRHDDLILHSSAGRTGNALARSGGNPPYIAHLLRLPDHTRFDPFLQDPILERYPELWEVLHDGKLKFGN